MEFVVVNRIPEMSRPTSMSEKKSLRKHLDSFVDMDVKYVKVKFSSKDYSDTHSAFTSIRRAISMHCYPIKACKRNGYIYLERTDLHDKPKCKRPRKKVDE